jgi:hypothetical protein
MAAVGRSIKARLPGVLTRVQRLGQRFGVNVTPNHFYSELADLRELERTGYWRRPLSMFGIQGSDLDEQLAFARGCINPCLGQLLINDIYARASAMNGEPSFGLIEAEFLYFYLRSQRPSRIVQVGCGLSTAVALTAIEDDASYGPELVCVEPYPTRFLRERAAAGQITLVEERAQCIPLERFTDLGPGDLLFVDSTHSLRVGGDVVRLICEVMPRLAAGVRLHFHDIPFPYDYSPRVLETLFIFREPVLLYAMLVDNPRYSVDVSLSMLHYGRTDELQQVLPNYRPCGTDRGVLTEAGHFPSSIYLRVLGEGGCA